MDSSETMASLSFEWIQRGDSPRVRRHRHCAPEWRRHPPRIDRDHALPGLQRPDPHPSPRETGRATGWNRRGSIRSTGISGSTSQGLDPSGSRRSGGGLRSLHVSSSAPGSTIQGPSALSCLVLTKATPRSQAFSPQGVRAVLSIRNPRPSSGKRAYHAARPLIPYSKASILSG